MAKLPPYSRRANIIDSLLAQGRRAEAISYAVEQLPTGGNDPLFLTAVAGLLGEPPPRKPGRPSTTEPKDWFDIGMDFEDLVASGTAYEAALRAMAARYGQSERVIQRTLAFYRKERNESDEASRQ